VCTYFVSDFFLGINLSYGKTSSMFSFNSCRIALKLPGLTAVEDTALNYLELLIYLLIKVE
jgi:hypothetical protein